MNGKLLASAFDLLSEASVLAPEQREDFYAQQCTRNPALLSLVRQLESAPANDTSSMLSGSLDQLAVELFAETEAADPLLHSRVGPYLVQAKIGEGGMGTVYRALHTGYGGVVALKVLQGAQAFTDAGRSRLQHEAELLERCRHPGIVQIFFSERLADGRTYFTMEYVEGLPITEYCVKSALSLGERLQLWLKVCEAVEAAHAVRVIHRDLKPSNVLVRQDGRVKLLDFGIAEAFGDMDVANRSYISILYAAPEHASASTERTDVYSLGVMLTELILGRVPFNIDTRSPAALRRSVLEHGIQPLRSFISSLPETPVWLRRLPSLRWRELEAICTRATQRQADARYTSVRELSSDLIAFLVREPVPSLEFKPPQDSFYRSWRFVSRNLRGVSIAATMMALMIALLFSYTSGLRKSRDAAEQSAMHARKMQEFAEKLFLVGDAAPNSSLTAEQLLDHGMQQARALSAEPEEQISLLNTLGKAYDSMGAYDKAGQALQNALDIDIQLHGSESSQAADTMVLQAALQLDEGQNHEALERAQHALAIDLRTLPAKDPRTVRSKVELAEAWTALAEYKRAVPLLEDAVYQDTGKPELTSDLSTAINDLSINESYLGHTELSISLQEQGLSIDRKMLGDRHPDIASHLMSLSNAHMLLGNYNQSEAEAREALSIEQEWLPPGHHEIGAALTDLGYALAQQNRTAEALPLLQQASSVFTAEKRPHSSSAALALLATGMIYEKQDRPEQSLKYYRECLAAYQDLYPKPTSVWAAPLRGIAAALLSLNRPVEAEAAARQGYAIDQEYLPPEDSRLVRTELLLGQVLQKERRDQEASFLLRDSLRRSEVAGPSEAVLTQQATSAIAELHLHQASR